MAGRDWDIDQVGKIIHKAPLVSREDRPVMGLHSDRDCVHTNALETIR